MSRARSVSLRRAVATRHELDLMANCAFDACFTSGENVENIDSQVDEILVDPII